MRMRSNFTPNLAWLRRGKLVCESLRKTAAYPYDGLKDILAPEDCRRAVLDETAVVETECGRVMIEPLY